MKKILPHLLVVVVLFAMACVYFMPILQGMALPQGDIQKWQAMSHESTQYHEATGDYVNWNSTMFGGMPNYQIGGAKPSSNLIAYITQACTFQGTDMQLTIGILFLYLLGFYVALVVLGCSPLLALVGAVAFGLGSYNIIIIAAGHITKAVCMALMMPMLAGMLLCFKTLFDSDNEGRVNWAKVVGGVVLFTIAITLQLANNHIQITYYTAIGAVVLGLVYLVYAVKRQRFKTFLATVALLLVGCVFAIGCNARLLFSTMEYTQYTMRGGSELTVTPADLYGQEVQTQTNSEGLDIDYAYSWSYGIGETYTLLVPGAMGGGSGEPVDKESASYKAFHQEQMPLYWGDQPFTSGPVYFGAIVVFLFVLSLFVVKGPERWWVVIATLVAVMLSWGRNFMGLNEWVFYHLPLYNKFRTPSMSLVLANVVMVFAAVLALKELFAGRVKNKSVYWASGITVGILLVGLLLCGGFDYSGLSDEQMAPQYGSQWDYIRNIFIQDRKALFVSDTWRSLIFVLLAAATILVCNKKLTDKGKGTVATIATLVLGVLMVADLWGVDRRYLNEKNFVRSNNQIALHADPWDADIDQQAATFGDVDYRCLNLAVNTFNDSKPSAFHRQVGGYSAVKMRRYQDIIDFYFNRNINPAILNMLNTRYVVVQDGRVQRNPDALGNAWFVNEIRPVADANEEILALNDFNPATTAVIDQSKFKCEKQQFVTDSTASIVLQHDTPYNPDHLTYHSNAACEQLAVFSEIYYAPDWKVYIDGKPAEYMRADYLLRAMLIPAGSHTIEFVDEAPLFHRLDTVSLLSSILLIVVVAGTVVVFCRNKKKERQ